MSSPVPVPGNPGSPTGLFDAQAFDAALAQGEAPVTLFRATLKHGNALLWERFRAGASAPELVHGRAGLVDELVVRAWYLALGAQAEEITLAAVGGYGRGELHPHSDVDLTVLLGDDAREAYREGLERFFTFLWDIGLEVGHSTRSLDDCAHEAAQDITVATNLMEARWLAGPVALFEAMREVIAPQRLWPSRAFFEAKWKEQQARHHRFHDTAYNLEPNIKEGPGGLRDIHVIGWVAKRHFGANTLHDLVGYGFLTENEYGTLVDGQNLLWRIRFALHSLTGRREDRLLFDHQRALADLFGFRDEAHALGVEQFMQRYYRTITELNRLNEMLLQLFQEAILLVDEDSEPVPINRRFQARRGFIEVTSADIFRQYPFALLELFLLLAQHAGLKGVRASTIRLLRDHRYLIDETFRRDVRARSLFMEILRQPGDISDSLLRMNRYGVLAAYLPPFSQVVGQMQFDLFHAYTVDEHTVFVLRNAAQFAAPERADDSPLCSEIYNRLPKPELLYIAALFHDIAKGRGGDHSELGAADAEAFCTTHGLSAYDTRIVKWLVEHHLIMSMTAQRRDISDPETIAEFAHTVADQVHLDYLYLLTIADIRGTNPQLWNAWRAALLLELYTNTKRALRRGLEHVLDQAEFIRETKTQAQYLLEQRGITQDQQKTIWADFPEDYFLRHSADEIAWQTEAIAGCSPSDLPLVLVRRQTRRGGTAIFLYTKANDHLFAVTTAALDQLGLDVLDARIITSDTGYTLDTYLVLEGSGDIVAGGYRTQEICEALRSALHNPPAQATHVARQPARQLKHFVTPTEVRFDEDPANERTILELHTGDRPGLLSQVGKAFLECGVRIQNAKVTTLGMRTEDIFYITDDADRPLTDPAQFDCLRRRLTAYLDESLPESVRESMKANVPQRAGR